MWVVLLIIAIALFFASLGVMGGVISLLWALLIGAVVGVVANWIVSMAMPAGGPRGFLESALAGIVGSYAATLIVGAHGLGWTVLGAIIVVAIWKAIDIAMRGGRTTGYAGTPTA